MRKKSLRKKIYKNQTLVIISAAIFMSTGLTTFEFITGLPASLRSDPVYNVLPMPSNSAKENMHLSAHNIVLMDRLCERVVRRFAHDEMLWTRVQERILRHFGFECKR